jgi:acyl-CoA reductase-like NAD-dependent aldehyde dehydrogenase
MAELPRVTYSNIGVDFSPVHAHLDAMIPGFEKNKLGLEWSTPFATGAREEILSPIDGKISLGKFPVSTAPDLKAAIKAARAGAKAWNRASLEERLAFGARWREALAEMKYDLGLAALYEIGKSRMEAVGEAEECLDMVDYYASELKANNGFIRPMNELVENETATSFMKPYGVFAVIAPFNFPLALSIGMVSGALLTGNAVVYKPSPGCALTGLLIAESLRKAGLPDGVFSIVLGDGEVGRLLATDDGIDGVAFTGFPQDGHEHLPPHGDPAAHEACYRRDGRQEPRLCHQQRRSRPRRARRGPLGLRPAGPEVFGLLGRLCRREGEG